MGDYLSAHVLEGKMVVDTPFTIKRGDAKRKQEFLAFDNGSVLVLETGSYTPECGWYFFSTAQSFEGFMKRDEQYTSFPLRPEEVRVWWGRVLSKIKH